MNEMNIDILRRMEKKKRQLEIQLEKCRGESSGIITDQGVEINKHLQEIKELLESGIYHLSKERIEKLEKWLS